MVRKKIEGGENKMEQRMIMRPEYFEKCPKCEKEIRGSSPKSAIHNLKIHLLSCPSNKKNEKS